MIKVYPTKIEAVDETNELVFTIEAFDQHAASVTMKTLVGRGNIEEITDAMIRAVTMLELE